MTRPYRIYGSEMSPYSVKVRSWFRFKGLAHVWEPRNATNEETYRQVARLPIVPTVVTPDGPKAMCSVKYSFDERIEDGLYCARGLELLKGRMEDPAATGKNS